MHLKVEVLSAFLPKFQQYFIIFNSYFDAIIW